MRAVRWAVPVVVAVAVLVTVIIVARPSKNTLLAIDQHKSARVSQQAEPTAPPHSHFAPSDLLPRLTSARLTLLGVAALTGWIVSLLLVVLIVCLVGQWRTAFQNKEWLLVPSDQAQQLRETLQALAQVTVNNLERVSSCVATTGEDARAATKAIQDTRAEFTILRDELDNKTKEVVALRLGQEFHFRRPVLMRVIRALDIIDDDLAHERDIRQTLEGVRVELHECLEDNAVIIHTPAPGTPVADAKGVDVQGAKQEATQDAALRGTISSTERPAYVARGPQGAEEVLVPAKVRVYV